jgi:hypothetical protein
MHLRGLANCTALQELVIDARPPVGRADDGSGDGRNQQLPPLPNVLVAFINKPLWQAGSLQTLRLLGYRPCRFLGEIAWLQLAAMAAREVVIAVAPDEALASEEEELGWQAVVGAAVFEHAGGKQVAAVEALGGGGFLFTFAAPGWMADDY